VKRILAGSWFVLLPLACAALGTGCAAHKAAPPPKGPPEVEVSLPVSKDITDFEEFSGRLESASTIQIRARVTGYLLENPDTNYTKHTARHYFKEGGEVKQGDLLFKIDPQLYEAELARATSSLEQTQAHERRLKADLMRAQRMYPTGTIGREEFDKIKGDYSEAVAAVGVAQAALKTAQVNMDYTTVRAPISGRISRAMIDPGNLVKADDTILTSIGSIDPIKAYFDVDERTVARVVHLIEQGIVEEDPTGTPVNMALADEEGWGHDGKVDFFDTYVDPSTGTLRVRGAFDNPKGRLVPGMFVRVRLPLGQPQSAVLVAEKALVTDQGKKFVYVVTDEKTSSDGEHEGQVKYRPVKLGRLENGLRVIKEGLSANEKVVVSGLQRLGNGRQDVKIKFKEVKMPVSTGQDEPNNTSRKDSKAQSPTSTPFAQPGKAAHPKKHGGSRK
jgi:RND family efflux transporter MFP subunit